MTIASNDTKPDIPCEFLLVAPGSKNSFRILCTRRKLQATTTGNDNGHNEKQQPIYRIMSGHRLGIVNVILSVAVCGVYIYTYSIDLMVYFLGVL